MIEKHLRHYLLSKKSIRDVVGGNHVYAGRIPQGEKPVIAILITRASTERYYELAEEAGIVSTTLELEFVTAHSHGAAKAADAAEQVRLVLSSYRGNIGAESEQVYVHSATIERDFMPEPVRIEGSDRWAYTYSMDWRITHNQTAVATP